MGRTYGTPNKITAEVRDKLQNLIDDLIKSLDIHELDTNQKIKMLQLSLQYTLPRLQAMVTKEVKEDVPLFIEWECASGENESVYSPISDSAREIKEQLEKQIKKDYQDKAT
tara:strand:+ start:1058 stop:1393 length:336 start_codon:yes stop_codon:yes gene_type:complete